MNLPVGLTAEQHTERLGGVGASEVHRALNLDAELWALKTRRLAPKPDDAFSRLGLAIQDYIVAELVQQRPLVGHSLNTRPDTLRSGRLIANPDALIYDDARGVPVATVEAKWRAHREGWGEPGSADVPDAVALQAMQQAMLAGAEVCYVPVLFMRPPVIVYELKFDAEIGDLIRAGVERFWWYVENDTPPPVEAARPEAVAALRLLYPTTDGSRVPASPDLVHWRAVLKESNEERDRYDQVAQTAKAHLLNAMKSASELDFGDGELFRRRLVKAKGYTVDAREYVDCRFVKAKGESNGQ